MTNEKELKKNDTEILNERDYWLNQFVGFEGKSIIPYDNATKNIKMTEYDFTCNSLVVDKLNHLCKGSDYMLHMVLIALVEVLIYKYTRTTDVVIGTTIYKQEEEKNYINTVLAIRNTIQSYHPFKQVLLNVRKTMIEANKFQNYSYETLKYKLGLNEEENKEELFDVAVILDNIHDRSYLEKIQANLVFEFHHEEETLNAVLRYNAEAYSYPMIQVLVDHFNELMDYTINHMSDPIANLSYICEEEKNKLLYTWNHQKIAKMNKESKSNETLIHLFEQQVEMTKDAIAVYFEEENITYKELNQKAEFISQKIRNAGSNKGEIIGIISNRSIEMIVGMIAILKAGCAYLPIEPDYPNDRIQYMLHETKAKILLRYCSKEIGSDFSGRIIDIDLKETSVEEFLEPILIDASDLAYIIYTSGSTGKPKGVAIRHGSIANTLLWRKEYDQFGENDCNLQIPSFCFDSSVEDIFTPLISGSSLVMISNENRYHLQYIKDVILKHHVTHCLVVPGFYKTFLAEISSSLKGLKAVTVAGDRIHESVIREHFEKLDGVRLINEYGPTENSVCTTVYEFSKNNTKILIGSPINNVQCYLLDQDNQLCGIGVPGELFVSGYGLAKEYFMQPELTKERFVDHLFLENEKMYRTSDCARWLPDGNLEFLGRSDNQVKIRGFRIEIGEIENSILSCDKVQDVVVRAIEKNNEKQLVAYLIPRDKMDASKTREFIAQLVEQYLPMMLPYYMIPSKLICLESYPLLTNGKIDYKTLETMEVLSKEEEFVEARTELEKALVELWKKLLEKDRVGIHQNFFELGGHSVLAIQMISRIKKQFRVEVTLKELFANPVISHLAELLESKEKIDGTHFMEITKANQANLYPISPIQYPEWFLIKLNPNSNFYNVGDSICLKGDLNQEAFIDTLNFVFQRHDAFKLSFVEENGTPYLKFNELTPLTTKDILDLSDDEGADEKAKKLVTDYFNHIFNLEEGPIHLVKIIRVKKDEYIFAFVTNHILWDQLSGFNLFREVEHCYNALTRGEEIALEPLTLNFVDYAKWLNDLIETGKLDTQKNYWLNKFKTVPEPACLPEDYMRTPIQTFNGKSISITLDKSVREKMDAYCQKKGTTYQIFLLSIFNLLIYRLSDQKDFVIGTPIANRVNEDIEKMIGLFAAALPIRCTLEESFTFDDLLEHTKTSSVEAYDNHLYPFNKVIEELSCDVDFSRQKIISIFFGVQNDETELFKLKLDDIETSSYQFDYDSYSTHFDVTLQVDYSTSYMVFTWRYNTDIYKDSTAHKTLERFASLVEQCIDQPFKNLGEYSLLLESDYAQLQNVNYGKVAKMKDCGVNEWVEAVAKEKKDVLAIVDHDRSFTFDEVNQAANQVANYLIRKGIQKGNKVAVYLKQSYKYIITILGIIKTGACFIPLSTEYPIYRIVEIDSQINFDAMIIENSIFKENLKDRLACPILVDIEQDATYIQKENISNPNIKISANDTLYMIFTSGSTGKPKGIEIAHRGVINLIESLNEMYSLSSDDAILFCTSIVFDASVLDIFWPLMTGFRTVVCPENISTNIQEMAQFIETYKVTMFQTVPLVLEAFAEAKERKEIGSLLSLRYVIVGAAVLSKEIKDKFMNEFDCKLSNHYGPTEITVDAAVYQCSKEDTYNIIPVGKPIHNTAIYVLDKMLKPCPIGVAGELYISSVGIAKGYVNNPELTNQVFIENSFDDNISDKLYRTGDYGCYLESGEIVVYGRLDNQIKINGNRVETEEVENRILRNPYLKNAAVLPYKNDANYEQLAAFVELNSFVHTIEWENHSYGIYSFIQNPSMKGDFYSIHSEAWPNYFAGSSSLKTYWDRIYIDYPQYQFALMDECDHIVGVVNTLPIYWNGDKEMLPEGWDQVLEVSFQRKEQGKKTNTLVLIAGVISSTARGQGLSKCLLTMFRMVTSGFGFDHCLVILRPIDKKNHQEISLNDYVSMRKQDGTSIDHWLELHESIGGKVLKVSEKSQTVIGTRNQWNEWEQDELPDKGNVTFSDTLAPVHISEEGTIGVYEDPGIWIEHKLCDTKWKLIDSDYIRDYLSEFVPNYMIPNKIIVMNHIPRLDSGKNDKQKLTISAIETSKEIGKPQNRTQYKIERMFRDILNMNKIGIYQSFFDLGGHSINALKLIARLSSTFAVKISVVDLYKNNSVYKLSNYLKEHGYEDTNLSNIQCLNDVGMNEVICIPSITTSPIEFLQLAKQSDQHSFYGIDMNCLDYYNEIQENASIIFDAMVQDIIDTLSSKVCDFIGYSMGARIGFHLIQMLEEKGYQVRRFIVLDAMPLLDEAESNQDFTAYAKSLLEHHPYIASIAEEEKERYIALITKYLQLEHTVYVKGKIKSEIHVICSETANAADYKEWENLSDTSCTVQKGKGTHFNLIAEENLASNMYLFQEYLK